MPPPIKQDNHWPNPWRSFCFLDSAFFFVAFAGVLLPPLFMAESTEFKLFSRAAAILFARLSVSRESSAAASHARVRPAHTPFTFFSFTIAALSGSHATIQQIACFQSPQLQHTEPLHSAPQCSSNAKNVAMWQV